MRQEYLIYIIIFFQTITEGGVNAILSPFLQSLMFSLVVIGYLSSTMSFSRLLSRLPAGVLYGFAQRRLVLFTFVLLFGASTTIMGTVSSTPALALAIITHGFSFGLITTILLALCMEIQVEKRRVGEIMGWYMAFNSAGHAVGNFLGGVVADHLGYQQCFLIMSLFTGATLLLQTKLSWPVMEAEREPQLKGKNNNGFMNGKLPGFSELKQLPKSVVLAALLCFFINALNDMMNTFFPLLALKKGISLSVIGFLKGIKSTSATLIRMSLGLLVRWVNYRTLNNTALLVLCAGVFLLPFSASVFILMILFMATGLGRGIVRTTSAIFMAEHDFKDLRAKGIASAVYNAGLDLGSVTGPVLGGLISHIWGLASIFYIFPVIFLTLYVILIVFGGRKKVEPSSE